MKIVKLENWKARVGGKATQGKETADHRKPADKNGKTLTSTRDPMPTITLQDVMNKVDRLPPLPQAALRVSRIMEEESSDASRIAAIIRLDAAFTSQVLRLCNSAAYGFSRKIATVKEAVAILGFATLKSMVYIILAKSALDHAVPGYSLNKGDLWINSLTCALYAKHIAQKEKMADLELAFTGGLLRDIGKIIIGDFVGESYQKIESVTTQNKIDFLLAEDKILGFNHCRAGTHLAERWNLPAGLIQIIRHHHHPSKIPPTLSPAESRLIAVVHLADILSGMMGKGTGRDGLMYCLDLEALKKHGIKCAEPDKIELLLSELVDLQPMIQDLAESLTE